QELKDHLATIDDESTYSIVDSAKENGDHEIFRTPPYHCELQPIEKIGGVVKNMVAARTRANMTALRLKNMLSTLFSKIPSKTLRSVWKTAVKQFLAYSEAAKEAAAEGTDTQGPLWTLDGPAEDEEETLEKLLEDKLLDYARITEDDFDLALQRILL
ncbi:hypothetical protein BGZ68_003075, partial [Mortierella alpina]